MRRLFNLSIFVSIFTVVIVVAVLSTAYFERDTRFKLVCSPFTERKGSYVRSCIPNPFRDTRPEQISEDLLISLKNNQLEAVLPYLRSGGKEPEKDAGREKALLPVTSWRIINREIGKDGRYRLSYIYRKNEFEDRIPIGFYFVKIQDEWKLDEIVGVW